MVRPTWTTDEQARWLAERKKAFADAQAASNTRAFLSATTEVFLAKWLLPDPTPEELAEADHKLDAAKEAKCTVRRGQIEWWFRDRARANVSGRSNASTAVLNLTRRRTQPLHPYQAYMHLYSDRVMPLIKLNYAAYKHDLPEGQEPREWWGYATAEAKRLLESKTEEVKAAVDAYRDLHRESKTPSVFDLNEITREGAAEATKRVRGLQGNILKLARTAYEACKAIEVQTGWKASLFMGGPSPEMGRIVTLTVHNGRTRELQNIFSEATEEWSTIQNEWDTFVARCYPPDLAEKLEKIHSGKIRDDELPGLIDIDDLPEADVTAHASASATPDSSSATSAAAASASPSATAASSSASAAAAATAAHPAATSTDEHVDGASTQDNEDEELDWEAQRRETIALNKKILRRVFKGKRYEDIVNTLDLEVEEEEEDVEPPQWALDGKEYLESVSEEKWWRDLVAAWFDFEAALKFPDGSLQANWLSPKSRPEEVRWWIGRARKYEKVPHIKSLEAFANQFRKWWARLQPTERIYEDDETWELTKTAPSDPSKWSDVRHGGCNGIFMVLMCLSWWYKASDASEDREGLEDMVEDVRWVPTTLTPVKQTGTTPSKTAPTPETSPLPVAVAAPVTALTPVAAAAVAGVPAPPATPVVAPTSVVAPAPVAAPAPASPSNPALASVPEAHTSPPTTAFEPARASPASATSIPAPAPTVSTYVTTSKQASTSVSSASPVTASTTQTPGVPDSTGKRPAPDSEHGDAPPSKKQELAAANMEG